MANNRVPINYHTPSFPSLYDPLPSHHKEAYYLYYTTDIWCFTLYWTLLFYGITHLTVAACAVLTHCRNWSVIWLVPLLYSVVAGLEGLLAGSLVGLVLVVLIFNCLKFRIGIVANCTGKTWFGLRSGQLQDVDLGAIDLGRCQRHGTHLDQLSRARRTLKSTRHLLFLHHISLKGGFETSGLAFL